jgi:SAM-dependent methyltransferase
LFLREMQLAGWQAAGIEPISSAAELARRRFGLEVFEGWLRDAPFAASSFDVLTFWDVLEHTFSPRSDLSQAARLLRSGGLLAINIPNWDSFDRRPFGANWQGFDPPRHLYMFSRETLTRLLTETGFEILGWVCFMPGFFAWTLSVKRQLEAKHWRWRQLINWTLALPGIRLLFEPWFAWMNWRGKGPVISVLARRVGTI